MLAPNKPTGSDCVAAGSSGDNLRHVGPLLAGRVGHEVALRGEVAVNGSGDSGGDGSADVSPAGEHDDHDQAMGADFVEGTEPAHVACGLEIRAGASLAEDGLSGVVSGAARGAEIDRAAHAELDVLDAGGGELQGMFDLRRELLDLLLGARVLQVVEGAAIGDGAEQCGEFEGRHRDAGPETGHHTDSAILRLFHGKIARLFAGDFESGLFAKPEHFGVVVDAVEAKAGAEDVEVLIIRVGDGLGKVKAGVPAGIHGGVLADQTFGERGERSDEFDSGARNEPCLERKPLVHHAENSAVGGVHHDHAAGKCAQGCGGGTADGEVVAIDVIAERGIDAGNDGLVRELSGGSFLGFLLRPRWDWGSEAPKLEQTEGDEGNQKKSLHAAIAAFEPHIIAKVQENTAHKLGGKLRKGEYSHIQLCRRPGPL